MIGAHLTTEQRALVFRLRAKGVNVRDIAKELGRSPAGINVCLKGQQRPGRPVRWTTRSGSLTLEEREEIRMGLARDESLSHRTRAPSSSLDGDP